MRRISVFTLVISTLLFGLYSFFNPNQELNIRIADVGPGLATVTTLPDGKIMVYDVGRFSSAMPTLKELVKNDTIDLLVLSHNDADHIGGVDDIEKKYYVKKVVYTTYRGDSCSEGKDSEYCKTMAAIKKMENRGAETIAVTNTTPTTGTTLLEGGGAKVTYLCGFNDPFKTWKFKTKKLSKPRNAVSIVIRIDYKGKSMIYPGDAVGKYFDKEECVLTEKFMLENIPHKLLDTDIIISPHHGAENGDCDDFIKISSPTYVIFSAGSKYGHPRASMAQRYINNGVKVENMFRTDRGDDDKDKPELEWTYGRIDECTDRKGDDDIQITITSDSLINVSYLYPDSISCK